MGIRKTRWSPDTCGCTVEYTWDDTVSEASRIHTLADVPKKCAVHAQLTDAATWNAINDENVNGKNKLVALISARLPALLDTYVDPLDGVSRTRFRVTPIIGFNNARMVGAGRALVVMIPGLTAAESTMLQTECDRVFGAAKVKVS